MENLFLICLVLGTILVNLCLIANNLIFGKGPCQGYLSIQADGPLGNLIGEYLVVMGLGLRFRLVNVVMEDAHKAILIELFPNISVPSASEIDCEIRDFKTASSVALVQSYTDDMFKWIHGKNLVIKRFDTAPFAFHSQRKFVLPDLQFHEHISDAVQSSLRSIGAEHLQKVEHIQKPPVFIGVHVRRRDLVTNSNSPMTHQLGPLYFRQVMDIYRQRYGQETAFVMASDDVPWIQEHFRHEPDVYFTHERYPGHIPNHHFDFAMLANTNHSVLSVGKFGFFSAYLAGGDVIFADAYLNGIGFETDYMMEMNVPRWQPLHDPELIFRKNAFRTLENAPRVSF